MYTPTELLRKSLEVNNYLNSLELPRSKWSGRTFVKTEADMPTFTGVKKKFATELFKVSMDKREEWLTELANSKGTVKMLAMKLLIKKVRDGG